MFAFLRTIQKTVTNYELPWRNRRPPLLLTRAIHPPSTYLRHLTGIVTRSALRAEPAENELAFPKNPLTERARGRSRHVVPLNILNIAAAVADEVVMPHAFRIESRGAALDGHFAHQTRLHQVPQIVVSRGP